MLVFEATMDTVVRVITSLTCLLLISVVIYGAIKWSHGDHFGGAVSVCLPASILVLAYLFSVTGYSIDATNIYIHRPLGSIIIPKNSVHVSRNARATAGAIRVWGNGGLFSISGLFYSKEKGWLHAYLRSSKDIVVLEQGRKTFLVSPDDVQGFMAAIRN